MQLRRPTDDPMRPLPGSAAAAAPMQVPPRPQGMPALHLLRPAPAGADGVADATAAAWQAIDATLAPVFGHPGAAALYQRALQTSVAAHPWLAPVCDASASVLDVAALHATLAQQPAAQAAACSETLWRSLRALLCGLVGPPLTGELLAAAARRERARRTPLRAAAP